MIEGELEFVRSIVDSQSGINIGAALNNSSRGGISLWFYDLGQSRSPTVCLRKDSLKRHQITLVFEGFSKPFVDAPLKLSENLSLARELPKLFKIQRVLNFPMVWTLITGK